MGPTWLFPVRVVFSASILGPQVRGFLGVQRPCPCPLAPPDRLWASCSPWLWPGHHLCDLAAPSPHPTALRSRNRTGYQWLCLGVVPTWSGIQPAWASVSLPSLPTPQCVDWREGRVCSLPLNIQEPPPAFSFRVAVYF